MRLVFILNKSFVNYFWVGLVKAEVDWGPPLLSMIPIPQPNHALYQWEGSEKWMNLKKNKTRICLDKIKSLRHSIHVVRLLGVLVGWLGVQFVSVLRWFDGRGYASVVYQFTWLANGNWTVSVPDYLPQWTEPTHRPTHPTDGNRSDPRDDDDTNFNRPSAPVSCAASSSAVYSSIRW